MVQSPEQWNWLSWKFPARPASKSKEEEAK